MQEQLPLTFSYRPIFGRKDFIVAPCNIEAVKWIDDYPHWPMPVVLICGEAGSGKSHLASIFSQTCIDGATLSNDTVFNMSDCRIVVENIDRVENEEALFHLYNHVMAQGKFMLMTARRLPQFRLKDLQSRINTVPKVYISVPDEDLIFAVLTKAFQERGLIIEPRVLEFVVFRLPRSFDAVQRLIEQADLLSLIRGQKVTVPLMKKALENVLNSF